MYADMICDVMPAIPEDGSNPEGTTAEHGEDPQANIEQLMVSMLEERDKVNIHSKEQKSNQWMKF